MGLKNTIAKICDALKDVPVIGGILEAKPKVAVIRLSGVIADGGGRRGGISYTKYHSLIEQAFEMHKLKAVALVINSPGGSPAQSALLGNLIRDLAEEHEIPVYAFVEDVAASGGYWLACAADKIYALDVSITGSIGVISASFGFEELIERYGVKRRLYTAGKDKSMLDPFVPEKASDVKRLKSLQTELHDSFIDWVRTRRGTALKAEDKDLFEGQIWTGDAALKAGIIDGLGDVRSICRGEFGEDVKFIPFTLEKGLVSGLIGGEAVLDKSSLSEDIADTIEAKALWARYGL